MFFAFIYFLVPIKICQFRFHRVHSESNVDCLFEVCKKEAFALRADSSFAIIVEQTNCSKMARQLTTMSFLMSSKEHC